jgi:hypothetical protein
MSTTFSSILFTVAYSMIGNAFSMPSHFALSKSLFSLCSKLAGKGEVVQPHQKTEKKLCILHSTTVCIVPSYWVAAQLPQSTSCLEISCPSPSSCIEISCFCQAGPCRGS